jgi:hypothetical protein
LRAHRTGAERADTLRQERIMPVEVNQVDWLKDVDAALAGAGARQKPLLLDFNAAPA